MCDKESVKIKGGLSVMTFNGQSDKVTILNKLSHWVLLHPYRFPAYVKGSYVEGHMAANSQSSAGIRQGWRARAASPLTLGI